jgi:glucokinase
MYIVFDIGGTKLRLACSQDGKNLDQVVVKSTPKKYDTALSLMKEQIKILAGESKIKSVRGGVPGVLNPQKTEIMHAANLPDWSNKPFVEDLTEAFDCEIKLENDSALAALGESTQGAGKEFTNVAYITVGTGIGGAWIINKKLIEGSYSFDPGHQVVNPNGPLCAPCNQPGHLETYIGTPEFDKYFIIGLYNTLKFWPSDIIVLGGGVILHSKLSMNDLEQKLRNILPKYAQKIKVSKVALGDNAGLYGALSI